MKKAENEILKVPYKFVVRPMYSVLQAFCQKVAHECTFHMLKWGIQISISFIDDPHFQMSIFRFCTVLVCYVKEFDFLLRIVEIYFSKWNLSS